MQQFEFGSLIAMASACIFGWPFAAFSGVMLAVGMLHEQGFYWFLKRTVFIGLLFSNSEDKNEFCMLFKVVW